MKKMILSWFVVMVAMLSLPWTASLDAREHKLYVVTTGDVHGAWFNRNYIDGASDRTSLMSVKYYVDSLRTAVGRDNVLLIDAGDCLQGDNAS